MSIAQFTIGAIGLASGSFFLLLVALLFLQHLRWRRGFLDPVLALFFWSFFATTLVMLSGLAGALHGQAITYATMAASFFLIGIFRKKYREILDDWLQLGAGLLRLCQRRKIMAGLLLTVLLVIAFRMLLHVLWWPPFIWDTLSYHLPKVADWIQHGRFVMVDTAMTRGYWPANFELLQTWFSLFFHHDFLIEAAGLPYYALAIASVYALCRVLRIRRTISAIAAMIYALTPAVGLHAVSAKNDIAVAALYLLMVAMMLDYRQAGISLSRNLLVFSMAMGLAFGTKAYILFMAPGLVLIGLWALCTGSQAGGPTTEKSFKATVFLPAIGCSLLLASFWYIRNYYHFGNPFFPSQFALMGQVIFTGEPGMQQGTFKLSSLLKSLTELATKRIFDASGSYNPDLPQMAGWGWFAITIGLPSSVMAAVHSRPFRWVAAGFLLSLITLLGWVSPDPWLLRFTLWFPAVLAVGFAVEISRLQHAIARQALLSLAAVCSLLNLLGILSNGYTGPNDWRSFASMNLFERHAADLSSSEHADAFYKIPRGEIVGYFTNSSNKIYALYGSHMSNRLRYMDMSRIDDIAGEMQKRKINFFYIDADANFVQQVKKAVADGRLVKRTEHLYRLPAVLPESSAVPADLPMMDGAERPHKSENNASR